jgi:GNAT superfamily N-acetyltransferase
LAYADGDPVAFIRMGPANDDVCTIIYDEKTTSIYGAFTRETERGKNIATSLLAHALEAARSAGYERCAVDFETMNLLGTRFWLRHDFKPVSFSLLRYVDERVV